jgi:GTPase SAR1 family protein
MKDRDRDEEVEHVRGRLPPQPVLPNILLFGSHGSGKSSLINMLAGQEASRTSDKGFAAFSTSGYALDAGGRNVVVWDVVGMRRGHGDEISEDAARNLRRLIQNLHGGVNLLVHCVNAKHPDDDWKLNYEAFYRVIGNKKVPIVLVVTGLEDHVPMEEWWKLNEAGMKKRGMTFDGHACITTIRGKPLNNFPGHWYDEQYEQSRMAVRELIKAKLAPAVIIREEGKLAELTELLREQNAKAVSQNGDKDKGKNTRGAGITGRRDVNDGHRSTQDSQWDDDMTDRVEREGRTASLALLGGLFAVFIVLQSGIMSCI